MPTDYYNSNSSRRSGRRPANFEPPVDSSGKLPPHATDLERLVLGALMLEKDAYMIVCDILTPDAFYEPRHQHLYEAITQLGFNQRPIDMETVIDQLRKNHTLEQAGGIKYITELTSQVLSAAHVEYHARIVAQKYLARRLINFSTMLEAKAFDEAYDVDDLLQEAEGQLFEISQAQLKREVTQIDPVLNEAVKQMEIAANRESGLSGLTSGFYDLDRITSGWQNSDLVIIAARPAMGKTAFVLSMVKNMAVDNAIPVGVFSLEMSNVQLANRLISNVCELPGEKIKSGRFEAYEQEQLHSRLRSIYGVPIYLDETAGLSITEMRTKARRLVRERGVKIIIIDYLQLMNASGMKFGNREQEVSTISRSLKEMAKELNVPVIALSQLSRANEAREDKRPMLSDLRESGAIEQDADIVCFIHRPEYYLKSSEDHNGKDIRGLAEFIVAKHRSGAVGDVNLRFIAQYAKFDNWDAGYNTVRETLDSAGAGMQTYPSGIFQGQGGRPSPLAPAENESAAVDLSPVSPDEEIPF